MVNASSLKYQHIL